MKLNRNRQRAALAAACVVLLCCVILSCLNSPHVVPRLSDESQIVVYKFRNGRMVAAYDLSQNDEVRREVNSHLLTTESGFSLDFSTYVPTLIVKSSTVQIVFSGEMISVSTRESKQNVWRQRSRKLRSDDIALQNLIAGALNDMPQSVSQTP